MEHGVEGTVAVGGQAVVDVGELNGGEGLERGEFEVLLVAEGGGVGGNEVAEERNKGEKTDDDEACHGEFVAAEAPPRHLVERGAAGGSLPLDEEAVARV